jgi:2-polyprenyl-3-methyl-5-hydroxy-6-metoxy-1,4-benzoquinol methylase
MENSISAVCELIAGDAGLKFLHYMRDVYLSQPVSTLTEDESREMANEGQKLGLLIPRKHGRNDFSFTAPGFLVGNIAKEYCNWLDNGKTMPQPRPSEEWIKDKDVLDLGCSIGRWLWEFQPLARSVGGLELREEYIQIGQALAKLEKKTPPKMIHGGIEDIDHFFQPESADFIFCRLVLNHVAIQETLPKMVALLRKDGMLWIEVESFRFGWRKLCTHRGLKGRVFGCFGVFNSLFCELTGSQMNFRYSGRHQSDHRAAYPSRQWWLTNFAKAGIAGNIVEATECTFCVWGKKK